MFGAKEPPFPQPGRTGAQKDESTFKFNGSWKARFHPVKVFAIPAKSPDIPRFSRENNLLDKSCAISISRRIDRKAKLFTSDPRSSQGLIIQCKINYNRRSARHGAGNSKIRLHPEQDHPSLPFEYRSALKGIRIPSAIPATGGSRQIPPSSTASHPRRYRAGSGNARPASI
jgi:hypothetical protein